MVEFGKYKVCNFQILILIYKISKFIMSKNIEYNTLPSEQEEVKEVRQRELNGKEKPKVKREIRTKPHPRL